LKSSHLFAQAGLWCTIREITVSYSSISHAELVQALAQSGEPAAWDEFIRRYNKWIAIVVYRTARRWGQMRSGVLDDLIQQSYLKLCDKDRLVLRRFNADHPNAIYAYLAEVTANVVRDHFKSGRADKRESRESFELAREKKPVRQVDSDERAIERGVLRRQIDECLEKHTSGPSCVRDRRIFWLYYQQGVTAREIASIPYNGLPTKGVEAVILRLTRLVRTKLAEKPIEPNAETGSTA
jgi:RNA polymerase sigma-70 factor, ECF subfamily